jgi:multicomponent Na+:H+ antiporter subunit E
MLEGRGTLKRIISLFLVMFVIWILIAGIHVQELIVGALVSIILSIILSSYLKFELSVSNVAGLFIFLLMYIPRLILELIKANLDVAKRVLKKDVPVKPGIVKINTELKSDLGKLTLLNSITLTPGTISLDAEGDDLYIHWIEVSKEKEEEQKKVISGSFESILRRVFK